MERISLGLTASSSLHAIPKLMSDRFYQWAKNAYDHPEDEGGTVLGDFRLSGNAFWWLVAALGSAILFAMVRFSMGLTVWTGLTEVSVSKGPEWLRTPVSMDGLRSEMGLLKSVPALSGQQIVIDYELKGTNFATASGLSAARISVTCLCPSSNWASFAIPHAAKGQFVIPVKQSALYTVDVYQAPQRDGSASIGQYYWGVRQAQ